MKNLIDNRPIRPGFPGMIMCPLDNKYYYKDNEKCVRYPKCFDFPKCFTLVMSRKTQSIKDDLNSSKMIQLTTEMLPDCMVKTQYGEIDFESWLMQEAQRIQKNPDRMTEIKKAENGKISLWVNEIA